MNNCYLYIYNKLLLFGRVDKLSISCLDMYLPKIYAITFNNDDYGKRESKLPGSKYMASTSCAARPKTFESSVQIMMSIMTSS